MHWGRIQHSDPRVNHKERPWYWSCDGSRLRPRRISPHDEFHSVLVHSRARIPFHRVPLTAVWAGGTSWAVQWLLQNQSSKRGQNHWLSLRLNWKREGEAWSGWVWSQLDFSWTDILELCPAKRGWQGSTDILDQSDGPANASEPRQEINHEAIALLWEGYKARNWWTHQRWQGLNKN